MLNSFKAKDKPYWVTDEGHNNLRLYVGSTGKTWYVDYRGENGKKAHYKLGSADALTVAQAREQAKEFEYKRLKGENVKKEKPKEKLLLGEFMDKTYASWRRDNHKAAQATLNMLKSQFGELFYSRPIDELKISEFYAWRSSRLEQGKKTTTVNKNIVALKAALKWGVKQGYIESNPLEKMELLKEYDSEAKVRYLSDDERQRLMSALDEREKRIRAGRTNHNEWLDERERPLMPELDGEFADHIKPMVLLSLHTGMRQGNLFALKWGDIDFESRTATLRAAVTKTGKTIRIPLNSFSVKLLSDWRAQCANSAPDALIFPSPVSGAILTNVKKAWAGVLQAAQIENFRWHDMRHDFASQLVMLGVDLNTVRELMGHADMAMTMRYAHLAPSVKLQAVELLAKA
jgi:integrase